MIEFDVDMGYLLECDELDKVVLNDENGEHEPMEFVPKDAATVGTGTLTAEQVRECVKGVYFEGYSDGATHRANGIEETDWQAIADRLNAMLGAETCQNISDPPSGFLCSECGWGDFSEPTHLLKDAKHCPNCGKRIVEEKPHDND